MIAENLFLAVAASCRRLPNVRGKVRALLALYRLLGLETRHLRVERVLHDPLSYRVRLDLHSLHERMALLMDGYEADTVSFLFRLFDQAGCFVDVGANIGLISLPFTRLVLDKGGAKAVGRSTPIAYSIEPVRSNYETLAGNIELNGSGQWVRPLYVGVGEREKTVEIAVEGNLCDGEGTGTANVVATGSPYVCERILLHVTTIDTLVRTGQVSPKVTLLKLDTDGYDLFALMGAARLLSETRPVVFGEFMAACMKWHGQTIADVAAFAGQAGYETFVRVSKTWRFTPLIEPEAFVQDLLLVPREKKDQVLWCLA